MKKQICLTRILVLMLITGLALPGCSGKGTGGVSGAGSSSGTTVISGKVSLSSSVISSKPAQLNALFSVPKGKPGSKTYSLQAAKVPVSGVTTELNFSLQASALSNAKVELYDADHPEWLYPVASGSTDANGDYSLSTMSNAANNPGATYLDGDPLPAGKYTLVAYKAALGQKPEVAVQTVVKEFNGAVTNVDFEVLPSDVAPSVITMFGVRKNTDGTDTWGSAETKLPASAAIQITFSMPMVREYLAAIQIESATGAGTVPTGKWALSSDWLTATYYSDAGQQFTNGEEYTVTIPGADDTQGNAKPTNVYGNPIDATAVGTFTATAPDTLNPTIQWSSPSVVEMGTPVDVTQSFRVESNEMLDVNGITLAGSPSIGAKPGVIFLGRNSAKMYIYEFVLGEPLVLDQTYTLKVYGGRDLSGNPINVLTGSIRTKPASETDGIDPNAAPETQNLQAKVKSVFGRWYHSFNDRSLAQLQSLMSGEFYMEYDSSNGINQETDVNRDGRFSFAEFSNMIAKQAFVQWDYCGTTINGTVIGYINVNAAADTADFEFSLNATNQVLSRACGEAAPKEHMFLTLRYKNGAWRIVRASEGIDTRAKTVSTPGVLKTQLAESAWPYSSSSGVADGGLLHNVPMIPGETNNDKSKLRYSWEAAPGVSSYVLVVIDARRPQQGRAVAFPVTQTSAASDQRWVADLQGKDVSAKFGLQAITGGETGQPTPAFRYVEGGRYFWEVIALGSIAPADINQKTVKELLGDIAMTSSLKSFTVTGTFKEIFVEIRPGTSTTAAPVGFSEMLGGYDVGSAYRATIKVRTPNVISGVTTTSHLSVSGGSQSQDDQPFDANGFATHSIVLFKGWNYVTVCDDGQLTADPPDYQLQLCRNFGIMTTGGIPPVIGIWDVTDDQGNVLKGDVWNFYSATTGATRVTIEGAVSDTTVSSLYVNLWNEMGANSYTSVPVTVTSGVGLFSFTTNIYQGNNWIGLQANGANYYSSNLGIYTDTGAVWVPPITVSGITTATLTKDYGYGSDWDASADSDDIASIQGKFKNPQSPGAYWISNDNGYANGQIIVGADGTFTIDNITLYNGWNYVYLSDNGNANYYSANIYTSAGKPVIRTRINTINNQVYDQSGNYATAACYLPIQGTALAGPVTINWNGYDGANYYSESQTVEADAANAFNTLVAVVGGPNSYNYINVYNQNGRGTNVTVTTSGQCSYAELSVSLTGVTDLSNNPIGTDAGGYYQAGSNTSVRINGTDTRPNWPLSASAYVCGAYKQFFTSTSGNKNGQGTYDWTVTVPVYDQYTSNYDIRDGYSGTSISFYSTNGTQPPAPMSASVTGAINTNTGSCGSGNWDVSAGGTSVKQITITGTTTGPDGTGTLRLPTGGTTQFAISGKAFTIPAVTVYDGWNYFEIYDTKNNYVGISVLTANLVQKPQFVKITQPAMNGAVGVGSVTVQGTVTDTTPASGYAPNYMYGMIYDGNSGVAQRFSTDLYEQTNDNYGVLNFDAAAGTFSFTGNISSTASWTEVYVYGYDSTLGVSHGDDIYVNTGSTWQEYYYKPGVKIPNRTKQSSIFRNLLILKDQQIHEAESLE